LPIKERAKDVNKHFAKEDIQTANWFVKIKLRITNACTLLIEVYITFHYEKEYGGS
jgi:hypothetical protein